MTWLRRKEANPGGLPEKHWLPKYIRDKADELRGYQTNIELLSRRIEEAHKDIASTAMMFDPVKEMAARNVWERRAKHLYDARQALGNARLELLTVVGDLQTSR